MSGYSYLPAVPALPAFLGGPAPGPAPVPAPGWPAPAPTYAAYPASPMGMEAWAPSPSYQMASLMQELARLQQQLDQLLAGLFQPPTPPAWPAPAPAPLPSPAPAPATGGPTRFVLSSFNVLSSSAGKSKGYAPGTARIHDVVRILDANRVGVVGFQEMAADQLQEFKKIAGDRYATFAGASGKKGYHDTTIAWRKDAWKLEQSGTITVPSYAGIASQVPYVRLRNKQTGQEAYFVDAHNPANTKRYHHQERYRDAAARLEADLVDRLMDQTGLPVFLVGDMNSVKEAHAIVTQRADVKAANPRGKAGIDWIFGSKDVDFSGFRRTREGLIARTTDHPVVFTDVRIGGR